MKVLHVYNQDNTAAARYVGELCRILSAHVETQTASDAKSVRAIGQTFLPDILHLHGQPFCKLPDEPRLVVTPHGQPFKGTAYAVIARSPMEAERTDAPRVETIRNPLITKTVTFSEVAGSLESIYRKVLDSHPLQLMNDATRKMLAVVLKVALCGDPRWVTMPLPGDEDIDWRHLYIYARLEGVLALVEQGIDLLGLKVPSHDATVEVYLPSGYATPTTMAGKPLTDMLGDIGKNGVTLLRLTDIFRLLYDEHLNEDILIDDLNTEKLLPLFASTLQLLSEQLLLDEGFMPCPPVDNSTTQQLRRQIENHLKL